ncbi:MAG: hypothetical protein II304_14685 [Bacteroidales bacterium]|nr:hypothetical protein [Bacteroidales bacterium]
MKKRFFKDSIFIILLSFVFVACDPWYEYYYEIENNTQEDLFLTIYSSSGYIDRYGYKMPSIFFRQQICSKSKKEIKETFNEYSDPRVFLTMFDSCIIQKQDSNGIVLKKWYRNYDLNSENKEFFDYSTWIQNGEDGCISFIFKIDDSDIELKNK